MRIGIILTGDYNWAGGLYYSLNIIKLLSEISVTHRFKIVVIINSTTPQEIIDEIPNQNTEISNLDQKSIYYKFYHKFFGNRFVADFNALKLDVLYPFITYNQNHEKLNCKIYYWLFDFQHKFLPQMFSQEEIKIREANFENIANKGANIIFSSNNALDHFHHFYPQSKANLNVYQFVSLINQPASIKISQVVPQKYFIVCNQFWAHKNHLTVLKAAALLSNKDKNIHFVFTGKYDYELSTSYVNQLKDYIEKNHLKNHITFTGFLSRDEQIHLIKNAVAVIQPSLFEGWSTVIEDAKALNKFVIASAIEINKEQLLENVTFFEPEDFEELALAILKHAAYNKTTTDTEYKINIDKCSQKLIAIFNL